jgi:hypothetical protein
MKPRFFLGLQPQSVTQPIAFCPELGFVLTILKSKPIAVQCPDDSAVHDIERRNNQVFWLFILGCLLVGALVLLAILSSYP